MNKTLHRSAGKTGASLPHWAIVLFGTLLSLSAHAAEHSALWGAEGERWNARSRLPDFSHAGYHQGEKPLPDVPVAGNVKQFGAKGDGTTDDSEAFQAALAAVQ